MGTTKANRIGRSIKQKYAECNKGKQSMSVGEYLERINFRKNRTWTLLDGQWFVEVAGMILGEEDFNKLYPAPVVPTFTYDRTNCDGSKKWMFE